jgi:hypothetical protein
VRRPLAILLLVLFSLPLIQPLLAMNTAKESNLPACCRRSGAHHCMMSAEQIAALLNGEHFTTLHSPCPMFPKAVGARHSEQLSFDRAPLLFAEAVSHPALHRQTEAWARVARDGARQKRGPPATFAVS